VDTAEHFIVKQIRW